MTLILQQDFTSICSPALPAPVPVVGRAGSGQRCSQNPLTGGCAGFLGRSMHSHRLCWSLLPAHPVGLGPVQQKIPQTYMFSRCETSISSANTGGGGCTSANT